MKKNLKCEEGEDILLNFERKNINKLRANACKFQQRKEMLAKITNKVREL